jgi:hypothetical protein
MIDICYITRTVWTIGWTKRRREKLPEAAKSLGLFQEIGKGVIMTN